MVAETEIAGRLAQRRTERLTLRRPTPADAAWLVALHSDPANYVHSPDPAHSTARAREIVEMVDEDWRAGGAGSAAIGYWVVAEGDEPVGMAGLKRVRFRGRECFNLYYRFVAAGRGRGLAAEACREALAVAAALEPHRPVLVRTRPSNRPARRLAEALGLQRRADLEGDEGFVVYVSAGW